ncbi:MAG: hypothetical protein ACRC92_27340 [Peptostreptococcaceae bacterium]
MVMNKYIPTGDYCLDVLLGQNKRNDNGEIQEIQRGLKIGTQVAICSFPGVGKTTLVHDITTAGYHMGYPLVQHHYFDTDNSATEENRLRKLTRMNEFELNEKVKIYEINFLEDLVKELQRIDLEYKAKKHRPVDVICPYTGKKQKMMPYVIITIDTVTSLKSNKYSIGGDNKAEVLANQQGMTEGRLKGDLCNSISNICDGNVLVVWPAHLKKNAPEMGKTIARKAYKSAPQDITDHLPERFRQKMAFVFWMSRVEDGNNLDSASHPIQIFGFGTETKSVYQVTLFAVKSRSSTENRSNIKLLFVDGKFDHQLGALSTLYNLPNGITQGSGMYPSAEYPHVFKEDPEYNELMGRSRKQALIMDGYDRPFNLVEARHLINYTGDVESVLEAKFKFLSALYTRIEKIFEYELECNNVTADEIQKEKTAFTSIYQFVSQIKREQNLSKNKLEEIVSSVSKPATSNTEIVEYAEEDTMEGVA